MERTLLLVDDEENILSALTRLLRRDGYRILTAPGGSAGLEVLAQNEVGVIISDQRMPEMNGTEFLSKVKVLYPDTVRIVLSGYTDLNSITDAINRGAIYKFLTKPWDGDLLRENIQKAFKHYEMARENEWLTQELASANEALSAMNRGLEKHVEEKTREVVRNLGLLQVSQEILEHLPVGVVGIDEDGMVAVANRTAHKLFAGEDGAPLMGDSARAHIPEDMLTCQVEAVSGLSKGVHQMPDGRKIRYWRYAMGQHSGAKGTVVVAELEG